MFDPTSIPEQLRTGNRQYADQLAARIENAALAVARPRQEALYDGWLLRYSPGKAKRARSINAIDAGVLPFAEKIDHCIAFYAHHRLPCLFRITPFSLPQDLDFALDVAGFSAFQDTRVMTLDLSQAARAAAQPPTARWVDVEQFARAFSALHDLDRMKSDAERERYARSAIDSAYIVRFDGDTPIACGSVAVDGALAGIFGMVTSPSHRGQGNATALLVRLLEHARAAGARTAYLQVDQSNAPARRAYARFGFRDCYAYWYRARADSGEFDATSEGGIRS
jgi:GNAT superfamily N-acetyltransferase